MRCWGVIVLVALLFSSCRPRIPRGVLSRSDMENVLYDFHLAQSLAEMGDSVDKRRLAYTQAVFNKHGITPEEFDSSMVWYCSHSHELHAIYTRISLRYEMLSATAAHYDEFGSASGDTVVLPLPQSLYALLPSHANCFKRLELVLDTAVAHRARQYMFRFDANFICSNRSNMAQVALQLSNDHGVVRSEMRTVRSAGRQELRVMVNGNDSVNRLCLYMYIKPEERDPAFAAFVADHMLLVAMP